MIEEIESTRSAVDTVRVRRAGWFQTVAGPRRFSLTASLIVLGACLGALLGAASNEQLRLVVAATLLGASAFWLALAIRRTSLGRDLPFLAHLGVSFCGAAIVAVTFNGLRISSHVTVADALLLASGGALVLSTILESFRTVSIPWWMIVSASLLLTAVSGSLTRTSDPQASLTQGFELLLALAVTPMLIAALATSYTRVRVFAALWLISASINGLVGTLDFLGISAIGQTITGQVFLGRVAGLTAHPNHLGLFCAMALPIALYLVSTVATLPRRLICGLLAALVILGVIVSGSRAALIAAALAAVLTVALQSYHRSRVIVLLAIGVVVSAAASMIVLAGTNPEFVTQRLAGGASVTLSDAGRLDYYQRALAAFAASPVFGNGFDLVRNAHDIYLQLLEAGGFAAFAGFGLFAISVLILGIRLVRRTELSHQNRALACSLTVATTVWLVAALTQNYVYDRALYVPAGLLLGLWLVLRKATQLERTPTLPFGLELSQRAHQPIGRNGADSRD